MGSVMLIVNMVFDIITNVLGHESYINTLLFVPWVLWTIRQVIVYFKMILEASYKKW